MVPSKSTPRDTGTNGKSVTSDQTYANTGNGFTQTGTVTGPKGNTSTDSRDVSYVHDPNGEITRSATGSITNSKGHAVFTGNTETYNKTVTPPPTPVN